LPQGYIDSTLSDFEKGLRVSEAMAASVQELGRLHIVAISMHYAEKPWPDLQHASAPSAIAQRAEHLISQGQCTASGCHVSFVGEFARPRVVGQSEEYLRAALKAYQGKTRSSYEPMEEAVTMSDADIEAMATYLAGLKQ
jgi:cytochrome c553